MKRNTPPTPKFDELIVYLCRRCDLLPSWGRTKLAKLLYFSDFEAYRRFSKPITEATYHKLPQGPVPPLLFERLRDLQESRRIHEIRRQVGNFDELRPTALDEANIDIFSPGEVAVIEQSIAAYASLTARQLSEITHREPGWKLARPDEEIPFFTALSSERKLTIEEEDYYRQLSEQEQ